MGHTLSVSIMHAPGFPDRRVHLADLCRALGDEALREHTLGFSVVEDPDGAGPWPTGRRALLEAHRHGATHHLVLQDDIMVCRDFLPTMKALIGLKPDAPLSPFAPFSTVRVARRRGKAWARIPGGAWGQAVCLPRELIDEFLAWTDRHVATEGFFERCGYDARLGMFLVKTKHDAWCPAPSLVEHVGARSSTLGFNVDKQAAWYIGDDASGLAVDWTRGLDAPTATLNVVPDSLWEFYRP
jgi:hypothetical protein